MSNNRNTALFFLFISPWLIGFLVFSLGPIIASIYWSFTQYSIVEPPRWVGLNNFYVILKGWEPNFYNSVRVTVLYSLIAVPGVIIVSLATAMLLNIPKIKGMSFFRTIYFLPSLLPMVASAIVFAFLLDPNYGIVSSLYEMVWGVVAGSCIIVHGNDCHMGLWKYHDDFSRRPSRCASLTNRGVNH